MFINAGFGLLSSAFTIHGVWIGWGNAVRKRLASAANAGPVPIADVAKRLARGTPSRIGSGRACTTTPSATRRMVVWRIIRVGVFESEQSREVFATRNDAGRRLIEPTRD